MKKKYLLLIGLLLSSIFLFSQVGVNTDGSNADPSAILDAKSTQKGFLPPRMTLAEMNAISGPAPGLMVYCTNCGTNSSGTLAMFINGMWFILNTDCLPPGSPVTGVHIPSHYQITWNWNALAPATGYKWNTENDYNTATDLLTATAKTETGLSCGTPYTRYVWAYNTCGISTATTLTQTTSACNTCGASITINHVAGAVAPVTKTITYGTVTNIPGETSKCWITSNLGADHQATSVNDATEPSAGWYWQFNLKQGYKHDGTTRTPATIWITAISENSDWISTNDPCAIELGSGWRLPTYTELDEVRISGNWTNWNGPWGSGLKLHAAGVLAGADGILATSGFMGLYWSSSQSGATSANGLYFSIYSSQNQTYDKPMAIPVRCVRDAGCLPPGSPVTGVHIPSSDQIIWNWNAVAGATGYKWSTTNNYATAIDMGTATTKTETGLTPGTTYTRYVWAYNTCGISAPTTLTAQTAQTISFVIGQSYGGGIIFYIDGTGQHGLIAATSDQSTGAQWGCYQTTIVGTSTAIGTGQANTTAIVNGCNQAGIAARICNDLVLNNYDDWFLPSKDELNQMHVQKNAIGGFSYMAYWSSSEYSAGSAWDQNLIFGWENSSDKNIESNSIRAVRAF